MQPTPNMMTGQPILTPLPPNASGQILINPRGLNPQNILGPGISPHPTLVVPTQRLPHPLPVPVPEQAKPPVKAVATPKPKPASIGKKTKVKKEVGVTDPGASKSTFKDDDDYNDVAAMGGVNLIEE